MKISLKNLSKDFGSGPVLKDVSLDIEDQELFFLLGPSGCGKTTLLRLLAGFYPPDHGEIYFDEDEVSGLGANERNTGMVFQNYALWPHLNVLQNVGYGLDVRKTDKYERDRRVLETLALVQMEDYGYRFPNELSGGQQQRVALARALVIKPKLLLFDEPLSNLDARLRIELREEIRALHQRTKITTVYVTHDHSEALSLADRIAVLNDGRIEQVASPRTIYRQPSSRFVADFVGETNWWPGTIIGTGNKGTAVKTSIGELGTTKAGDYSVGADVWVGFRPESARLDWGQANSVRTSLVAIEYLGGREEYRCTSMDGTLIKVSIPDPAIALPIGSQLVLGIPPESLIVLPRSGI